MMQTVVCWQRLQAVPVGRCSRVCVRRSDKRLAEPAVLQWQPAPTCSNLLQATCSRWQPALSPRAALHGPIPQELTTYQCDMHVSTNCARVCMQQWCPCVCCWYAQCSTAWGAVSSGLLQQLRGPSSPQMSKLFLCVCAQNYLQGRGGTWVDCAGACPAQ